MSSVSCCEVLNNFTTVLQVKPFETFGREIDHSELAHVQKKKKKVFMLGKVQWKQTCYETMRYMKHVTLTEASAHTEQKQVSLQINIVERKKCNITCKIPPNERVKYNTALE